MRLESPGNDRLRLGVLGCGAVATIHHLPAITHSRRAVAVALVDRDLKRARTVADRFGVARVAATAAEIAGEIDAAIVALPNHLHAPASIELLERGVHVLVEKPMALDLADCDRMIAASRASGARLAVGLEFRHFPGVRLVKGLLDAGLLGAVARFDLRLGVISRWPMATDTLLRKDTAGGGVLLDFGAHVLDLLLWWLGPHASVDYRDDALLGLESDCELGLRLAAGAEGTIEISRTRNLRNTCILYGERGILEAGIWDADPPLRLRPRGQAYDLVGRGSAGKRGGASGMSFSEAFRLQLDDFLDAVREDREPVVNGAAGRQAIELIVACYDCRQPLELPWAAFPPWPAAATT